MRAPIAAVRRVSLDRRSLVALLAPRRRTVRIAQLGAIVALGLAIRLTFIASAGYRDDLTAFSNWFRAIADIPLGEVYARVPGFSYPPMIAVLYKLEALALRPFVHGVPGGFALTCAIKLPSILFESAGAAIVYGVIRRHASHRYALAGAAFIACNPALIYDSAFWGQNDALPTVIALFALTRLMAGATMTAWLSITVAAFFKSPVIVLVPLMLLAAWCGPPGGRRARLVRCGFGIAAAALVIEIVAVTFFPAPSPVISAVRLARLYFGASNIFHYTSLNAFNVWALCGPFFASDGAVLGPLSLHACGDLLFVGCAAAVYWRFARRSDPGALLEAALLVLLALFVVMTEMHERYLYYAVYFSGTLVFRRRYARAAGIVSVTLLLNLEYALTYMYLNDAQVTTVDRNAFAPWLAHLCALANVAVFGSLLFAFVRGRLLTRGLTPVPAPSTDAGRSPAR